MCQAEHKAGPGRGRGVLGTDLGRGGLRAEGGLRGARRRRCFHSSLGKRHLLSLSLTRRCLQSRGGELDRGLRLGDARSNPVPSVVAYGDVRRGKGREWGGGDRGGRLKCGNLRRSPGTHLALFQGARCRSA